MRCEGGVWLLDLVLDDGKVLHIYVSHLAVGAFMQAGELGATRSASWHWHNARSPWTATALVVSDLKRQNRWPSRLP
jgi:hypothetical protein